MANANKWLGIGLKVATSIPTIISAVEAFKKGFSGPEKESAAVQLAKTFVETSEFAADKDLMNDAKVESTLRAVFAAVVAFQNAVAEAKQIKN